jgi:hypothetical protein
MRASSIWTPPARARFGLAYAALGIMSDFDIEHLTGKPGQMLNPRVTPPLSLGSDWIATLILL